MISNTREKPYRLDVRSDDQKTWRFVLEFDEIVMEKYSAIVEATNRKSGEVTFRIVPNVSSDRRKSVPR